MTATEGSARAETVLTPPEPNLNIDKPTSARVYDALLGGKDNFAADRAALQTYLKYVPDAGLCARENRDALAKGVRYLARVAQIDQFLDVGCGLPTALNTHDVARQINPDARVVYVDKDPMVLSHGRAMLDTGDTNTVITADLSDPGSILDHDEVRRMIDFDRPVALLVLALLMQFCDEDKPDEWVRTLLDAMPAGSHLFVTALVDTGEPLQKAMGKAGLETLEHGWIRSPERITEHFLGLPLVEPGLDFLARWFPEDPRRAVPAPEDLESYQRLLMAGIARKT